MEECTCEYVKCQRVAVGLCPIHKNNLVPSGVTGEEKAALGLVTATTEHQKRAWDHMKHTPTRIEVNSMKWLSIVYAKQPDPPWPCFNCHKQPAVALVRMIDWQRNDAIVDMRLCEDCTSRAKRGTLGLDHGTEGRG